MVGTTETKRSIDQELMEDGPLNNDLLDTITKSNGEIRPVTLKDYDDSYLKTICKSPPENTLDLKKDFTPNIFKKEKELECWVDEIEDSTIYARGRDVDELGPEITFELDIESVEENDRELVQEAAVFMVKIGTITNSKGQVTNKTIIKFRRFRVITEPEMERISLKAKLLAEALGIEN